MIIRENENEVSHLENFKGGEKYLGFSLKFNVILNLKVDPAVEIDIGSTLIKRDTLTSGKGHEHQRKHEGTYSPQLSHRSALLLIVIGTTNDTPAFVGPNQWKSFVYPVLYASPPDSKTSYGWMKE